MPNSINNSGTQAPDSIQSKSTLIDPGKTPVQLSKEIYSLHAYELSLKAEEKLSGIKEREKKMQLIHSAMREIRTLMKEDASLDIGDRSELQEKLSTIRGWGIEIPDEKKTKFSPHACASLLQNLESVTKDFDDENNTNASEIKKFNNRSHEVILMAKDILSNDDRTKRKINEGIR